MRLLACLGAAAVIAAGPPLSGARELADRVEIRRDTFGVPHILAEDEEAAGFGFGYAMAEDHAAEIGRRYLYARGDAARHFGAGELETDLAMQRLDNHGAARRALADATGRRFRRWLHGFAAGINRYVETHRDAVPAWMPVVEPSDPLAYGRSFGVTAALRPPRALLEKYPAGSAPREFPAAQDPADVRRAGPASGVSRGERTRHATEDGSNAFALAPSKTTTGHAILLGNPHLAWSSLYWEAHVTIPGRLNFYGSTLVGIPVLRAGFNDRIGYVQTNNAPDLTDIYSLPARGAAVTTRSVAVVVKEAEDSFVTVRREYEETDLGPVIHRTAGRVFVVRSINVEWPRQYEGFFELQQADSLREFRRTLGRRLAVMSNYTYADVEGNIFYTWQARLPSRRDRSFDYSLDVPAGERRLRWSGIHRASDLPSLLNPPGGYLQNANNPPWYPSVRDRLDPDDYPEYIERGEDLSLRAQLALDELERRPTMSLDDVRRLKFTTRVLAAERILPDLFTAAARAGDELSEPQRAGIGTLAAWDRTVGAASRGAVLFERFMTIYEAQTREPFAVPWSEAEPMSTPRGLADPVAALTALDGAVTDVRARHGSEQVAWGDVHRFRVAGVDLPADGAPGRYGVFRVIGFEDDLGGTRTASSGDAWVLLVHFTRPVAAWSVLAYGQTADPASPHSRDQIGLFANHELRPVWFSEHAIAAHLERRYRPPTVVDSAD